MGVIKGRLTTCVKCRSRARTMECGPAEWNTIEEERLESGSLPWAGSCGGDFGFWCGDMWTLKRAAIALAR